MFTTFTEQETRKRTTSTGLGVALLLAAVLMFLPSSQVRADAPSSAVFKAKCASCHGPDGTGSTPMGKKLNLRDLCLPDVQKQTDAELTKLITEGKGKMPAFATKLSADQIKALVVTIREMAAK